MASSQSSSSQDSSFDYQQYMKKYAGGGQGGQGGNYQQYYQKYMGKNAGGSGGDSELQANYEKYADYQKYMKRWHHQDAEEKGAVSHAHDAKNMSQLNAWKAQEEKQVEWYVPDEYSKASYKHLDEQYKERANELQSG